MQAVAAAGAGPRKPALRVRFARAAAPYLLILPGGGWLFLFFLLPILALAVTSLESGDFIAGFNFDWNVGNYTFGLQLYSSQFLHSIEYGGAAPPVAFLVACPAADSIAFPPPPRQAAYLPLGPLPSFVSLLLR